MDDRKLNPEEENRTAADEAAEVQNAEPEQNASEGAKNVELAHQWINFMLDPKVAAENTEFMQYLCPNKDAYPLLSESIRNNPAVMLPEDIKAVAEVNLDLGEENAKYTKVWDEIKAAN